MTFCLLTGQGRSTETGCVFFAAPLRAEVLKIQNESVTGHHMYHHRVSQ